MVMTAIQFRNEVRKLGEKNGPTGPVFYYPNSIPIIQVRFAKSTFTPISSEKWNEFRERLKAMSRGTAVISSDEWLFQEGFMEIFVNPCGEQVPLKDALAALSWLNDQILATKRQNDSSAAKK